MELKMFVSSDSMTVEKNVNDWLEENSVVVHHIGQSQSERNGKFVFTLSVFYEGIASTQKNKMVIA